MRKIVYKVLIAILTYINMNYLNKIKVDVNNEQYTYENIFNQKKNITNLENDDKNNQLVEYKKVSWFERLFNKIFRNFKKGDLEQCKLQVIKQNSVFVYCYFALKKM